MSITHFCVCMHVGAWRARVPLLNHHAKRMRQIFICCLYGSVRFLRHYLIYGMIFEEKLFNIKCVLSFSLLLLYKTFLILRRIKLDIVTNWEPLHVMSHLRFAKFLLTIQVVSLMNAIRFKKRKKNRTYLSLKTWAELEKFCVEYPGLRYRIPEPRQVS
jgi:hypothetical protein